jgi:hypothetical protein
MSKSRESRAKVEAQHAASARSPYGPWRRKFVWPWKPILLHKRNRDGQLVEQMKSIGWVWVRVAMLPKPHMQFALKDPTVKAPDVLKG